MSKYLFSLLLLVLLSAACTPGATPTPTPPSAVDLLLTSQPPGTGIPTALPPEIVAAADSEYLLLANIYARVSPSVVALEVITTDGQSERAAGFVYDTQGHIVTGAHVVTNVGQMRAFFSDGYIADVQIAGVDTFSDLALLQVSVDDSHLHPVTLGDSDALRVGQRALVIGNPFGLANSMTTGIISGVGRRLASAELIGGGMVRGFQNPSIIQVDASISGGNSGGPLLNSGGEVIGVVSAIQTESGSFQGVGFAIPSNTVSRIIPQLIATGSVSYAWLGVNTFREDSGISLAGLAEPLNLPVSEGVLVTSVTLGSPADTAGIRGGSAVTTTWGRDICTGGDIIVAINGTYLANMSDLLTYLIMNTAPGDEVTLTIIRGGQTLDVPVTLATRPTSGGAISECE
ncbi:MAG: trypsin-like peptidase domain-containing protein [Anaerolineae bacterium]